MQAETSTLRDAVVSSIKENDGISVNTDNNMHSKPGHKDKEELIVDVDLPNQLSVELHLRHGDNVKETVKSFCQRYEISERVAQHLEKYILKEINGSEEIPKSLGESSGGSGFKTPQMNNLYGIVSPSCSHHNQEDMPFPSGSSRLKRLSRRNNE